MGKFDGILICTDLDGTLLTHEKTISEKNYEAIEYFKKEGGLFTFVTGRMPRTAVDLYEMVDPNAPFGCINGGGVYDHKAGEYLYLEELSKDVMDLVEYIDDEMPDMGIQINTPHSIYCSKDNAAMVKFREVTHIPNVYKHYRDVEEPISKIIFAHHLDEQITLLEKLLKSHPRANHYGFIRSSYDLFEILPKGITKANSIIKLAEILNLKMSNIIAVGDYYNDVPMLKAAGLGVAVSNACDEAKKAADIITVSNEESAIAKIIMDLDEGKISL